MKRIFFLLLVLFLIISCKKDKNIEKDGMGGGYEDNLIEENNIDIDPFINSDSNIMITPLNNDMGFMEEEIENGVIINIFIDIERNVPEHIGQIKIEPLTEDNTISFMKDTDKIIISGVEAIEIEGVNGWGNEEMKYYRYLFENTEIGISCDVIIRENYKEWFKANLDFIYG